jgi:pimeloyl-ACP methyl ester carboxylesterase
LASSPVLSTILDIVFSHEDGILFSRHGLVVCVSFAGIAQRYDIVSVVQDAIPGVRCMIIDPLVGVNASNWNSDQRAQELCHQVTTLAPAQVVVTGYCTGAAFAAQVAAKLAEAEIPVSGTAVFDPVKPDRQMINAALDEMMTSLGCTSDTFRDVDLSSRQQVDILSIEDMILGWAGDYTARFFSEAEDMDALMKELADRYISWISFLCSSAWQEKPAAKAEEAAVFASRELCESDVLGLNFPANETRLYGTNGDSCLSDPDCLADFKQWVIDVTGPA